MPVLDRVVCVNCKINLNQSKQRQQTVTLNRSSNRPLTFIPQRESSQLRELVKRLDTDGCSQL